MIPLEQAAALEKIVNTGTPSERALARLAKERPADPQSILLQRAAYYGLGTPAMATLCGISAYWLFTEPNSFLLSIPGAVVGAIKAVKGIEQLSLTKQAWQERNHQCEFKDGEKGVFYKVGDRYTANPTRFHTILGQRVYPVDDAEAWSRLPPDSLVYIADAQITTADMTPYEIEVTHHTDMAPVHYTNHYLKGQIEMLTSGQLPLSWVFDREVKNLPAGLAQVDVGERYSFLVQIAQQQIQKIEWLKAALPVEDGT